MKKILSIIIALTFVITLFACNKSGASLKASMSMEDLAEKIKEDGDFATMLTVDDDDTFSKTFGETQITKDKLADYNINTNMIESADTLMIAEAKDKKDVETIKSDFEKIRKRIESTFEFYLPDPYEMAKNGEIITKGNYVMLVISSNNEKAKEIFNSSIK